MNITEDTKDKDELTEDEIFDQAWDEVEREKSTDIEEEQDNLEASKENSEDQLQTEELADSDHGAPEEESTETDAENAQDSNTDVDQLKGQLEQLQAENRALEQRMRSWEGRIRAANKRADEAEEKLKQATEKQDKADSLPDDEEEDSALSEFIDEFPTLEKPIKALIKKVAGSMVKAELEKVESRVKQVEDTQVESSAKSHIERITEAHPDWKDIFDSGKLTTWIEAQPKILQRTLNDIVENGSTEDIIEMFDQYKGSNNAPADQNTPSSTSTGRSKSERAAAMQAVPAKTGGPPKPKKTPSKDDFDAAWNEAISKL